MLHTIRRHIAAIVLTAALCGFFAVKGQAQCCGTIIVDNLSSCEFQVCVYVGGALLECRTLNKGSNLFWPTGCPPMTQVVVSAVDRCGNVVAFPGPGQCIDIPITAACCVQVCGNAAGGCQWEIRDGVCAAGC